MATISKERRKRFAQQFSFKQIARIAGWASVPPSMIGYGDSNASSRFPIQMASSQRRAQRLCDALNDRFAGRPETPRFGWLPASEFTDSERSNVQASMQKAQSRALTGDAAETLHALVQEVAVVDSGIGDSVLIHDEALPETCYVFVRFFFGLNSSCPFFERWVVLPDHEVDERMTADAHGWALEHWNEFSEKLRRFTARVQAQSALRLGTPSRSQTDEDLGEELEKLLQSMDLRHAASGRFAAYCAQAGDEGTAMGFQPKTPEVTDRGEPLGAEHYITATDAVKLFPDDFVDTNALKRYAKRKGISLNKPSGQRLKIDLVSLQKALLDDKKQSSESGSDVFERYSELRAEKDRKAGKT